MPQIESVKFHFIIEIESVKFHFIIDALSIGYLFYYILVILFLVYLLKDKTKSQQAEPDTFRWTLYSSSF